VYSWCSVIVACQSKNCEIKKPLFWQPPALEQTVQKIETAIGRVLPPGLRDTFLIFSKRFGFYWRGSHKMSLGGNAQLTNISGGLFLDIALNDIPDLMQQHVDGYGPVNSEESHRYMDINKNTLPFLAVGNGDMLGIDLSEADGKVIYLAHDSGPDFHGTMLGKSFTEFMSNWAVLGCVGPEIWSLTHFLNDNGIDLDGDNARKLQKWLGLCDDV
jgi:cell wall assembly regulator SMI1